MFVGLTMTIKKIHYFHKIIFGYVVLWPTRTKILERSLIYIVIAYENGADLGADYIECDVQITKVSSLLLLSIYYLVCNYQLLRQNCRSVKMC